jgi:autotransporter-associated beta strand protein
MSGVDRSKRFYNSPQPQKHMKSHAPRLKNRQVLSRTLFLGVSALSAASLHAQATWVGDTSNDWNNAANWSSDPATPSGNFTVNTATGNYPIVTSTPSFTPVDIFIGEGAGATGRVDVVGGTLSTGTGNWLIMGRNGGTGTLNVTGGTLNAADIHLGRTSNTGTATVNVGGTGVINTTGAIVLGDGDNAGATAVGNFNVNAGGTVNCENDLVLAFAGNSSTVGTVNIAAGGVFNVASSTKRWLIMSVWDSTSGVLNVNGGTLNLNANTDIRFSTGSWGPGASNGASSINLNSGSINMGAGAVVDLNTNADRAVSNTVNLNGGTLTTSAIVSTKANGARVVNFNGGTLRAATTNAAFISATAASAINVMAGGAIIDSNGFDISIAKALTADLVSTGGGLTKKGLGTLTLTGANTFTGDIVIEAGTLSINSAFIDDGADVSLTSGSVFDLSFVGSDSIGYLYIDGMSQAIGTYGAFGSGADFESPLFTGTGWLNVTSAIPEPSSFATFGGLVALAFGASRRRRAA